MDLHFNSASPTADERVAVDAIAGGSNGVTGAAMRNRRHLLLPVLHAVQERIGWISAGAVNYAGERLGVAPADVYGVVTFYAMFATAPRPPVAIHACDDVGCMYAGSAELCAALEARYGPAASNESDARVTWLRSPCLGLCDRAPAALVTIAGERPSACQIAPADADGIAASFQVPAHAVTSYVGGTELRLLRRIGKVDPESLDAYRAHGGYLALREAFELGPERVIAELVESKLMGRGGAAFPTGRKMEAVARAPEHPHYLICNADESEPGTFKDRIVMEGDPFAVIESMTIAAYATGCEHGYIYVRGEYPLAAQRLQHAIDAARSHGLLGRDVMGRDFSFDVEIRRGAGAYICGEETALFNSIEGKRGEPRSKPPFPVQAGLFGKPTQINNVETLVNLPQIVLEGGAAYARVGTSGSTGTRLFCLSGAVTQPGLYEVPHGTRLGALIELAGGVRAGHSLQALLLGGAAGTIVGPEALDMPLTFEDARAAGATLGSGVMMAFDETADVLAVLRRIARFFRDESCGQCVPCRVGTVRQEEALDRLSQRDRSNADRARDVSLLDDVGRAMRDASICGLGQTAANVVAAACRRFDLFQSEVIR